MYKERGRPGAARTVRATADRRRRGARGGGAARTVRATAAAMGPGGGVRIVSLIN